MIVTKESETPTDITLNVSMAPEDEEPFIGRSYRRLASRVKIPWFRPGKAPRSIVESHLGRTALVQEALEFMIPETLNQVLSDESIQAYADPQLELLEIEPVSFKAIVPLEPLVDLGDFRSIHVDREPVEVTEEQVDEVVEQLRNESAPWDPVERPVQFGDLLNLNVDGTIEGDQAINDKGVDFIPEKENPMPMPGFSAALVGMTAGETKELALFVPDDHNQEEYAGKECQFKVEVLSIKEKLLPELDDEFAKGIRDGYESLEALKDFVRQRIKDDGEASADRQAQEASVQELLKTASVQASDLIYQRELDHMYEERERSLRSQRMDMDTYLGYIGKTGEEWREELRPRAEERLNTYLVLRKLAEEESIEISPEDIQSEIDTIVVNAGDSEETMRNTLSSESAHESIRSSLVNRQVMARLLEITGAAAPSSANQPANEEEAEDSQEESDAAGSPDSEEPEQGAEPDA
ncbi:MAG: trigger factor [Chloroflexota bacterium]|nr:trigger factor [Chloroflexota bacterium]